MSARARWMRRHQRSRRHGLMLVRTSGHPSMFRCSCGAERPAAPREVR